MDSAPSLASDRCPLHVRCGFQPRVAFASPDVVQAEACVRLLFESIREYASREI